MNYPFKCKQLETSRINRSFKALFLREVKQQIANKNKMHYQLISSSVKKISVRAACGMLTAVAQHISPDSRHAARRPLTCCSDLPTDSITVTAIKRVPVCTNRCTCNTFALTFFLVQMPVAWQRDHNYVSETVCVHVFDSMSFLPIARCH